MSRLSRSSPRPCLLPLSEAILGSRLAEPVQDAQGNTLLAAGTELTDSVIRSLQRRDIETVCVLEAPEAEELDEAARASRLEAERARVKRQVEHLFRHSLQPDQINPLLHLMLQYRLESLS